MRSLPYGQTILESSSTPSHALGRLVYRLPPTLTIGLIFTLEHGGPATTQPHASHLICLRLPRSFASQMSPASLLFKARNPRRTWPVALLALVALTLYSLQPADVVPTPIVLGNLAQCASPRGPGNSELGLKVRKTRARASAGLLKENAKPAGKNESYTSECWLRSWSEIDTTSRSRV